MLRSREKLFEILIREHELRLRAFVRACVHDSAIADDLAQDTFLAAWERLGAYDPELPFARWLRGIARNKILGHFRSRATETRLVHVLSPEAVDAIAEKFDALVPGRGDEFDDCLAALRECLSALGQTEHHIVERVYRDNETCGAIASQIGSTTEAVKKRLQRARLQLRDCILGKLKAGLVHA